VPKVLRPIGHEDRLSVVDHLDELRTRLIVCVLGLVVAFGLCYWQNHRLLSLLNRPLPAAQKVNANHLSGLTSDSVKAAQRLSATAGALSGLAASAHQSPADRALFAQAASNLEAAAKSLPQSTPKRLPITIGVGEAFSTTLVVSFYAALLLTLPLLLYEAYAFVIPALHADERRVALPAMLLAPVLFLVGVVFAYVIVMPPAVHFLQGYNNQNFDNLVQAKPLYRFELLTMLGIGLAFQLPLGLLALQRLGTINAQTLTRHWRYATVVMAVIAAAMPGADPVTTGLEMLPLVVLYLASIVMLKIADRRSAARAAAELEGEPGIPLFDPAERADPADPADRSEV
jgi:sec-independent protein translocase protein TatC